jgi:FixJ family two-component response regulator
VSNHSLIAVVDDDKSVRESLEGLMRSVGFAVKTFASAEECLNWEGLRDTDCLILDVRMRGLDGMELHRRLIEDRWEIPVIFITAHGSATEMRAQALRNGAVAFLDKPLSEEELLTAIRAGVNGRWKSNQWQRTA